jgi:uracil phosphoribosyltransferase
MYRAKESLLPIQYYNRLPRDTRCDVAYVLDPCIATANTINAVVSILKRWGAKRIIVISAVGSRAGVTRLSQLHPDIDIFMGAVDEEISEEGMIMPGVGDAGDRQFGTLDEIPELMPEPPLSPTGANKRKKASS